MMIDQRRLFRLKALGGVGRVAASVDHGHGQRAGDGCDLIRPDAGQVRIVENLDYYTSELQSAQQQLEQTRKMP